MFQYPSPQVTRINLKPLLPPGALEKINPQKVLKAVRLQVLKKIQKSILDSTLSHRAKVALSNGMEIRRGLNSITVVAKHPAFRPLLEGRRQRQMRWLMKAKRPIPIITKEGKLIFRSATPRSMDNGSWYHPPRQNTTIIEKAREDAKKIIKARLLREFRKEVKKGFARAQR